MTKVLTTKEYKAIEQKNSDKLELTLIKKEYYNLRPFGKFVIKERTRQGHLPNVIPFEELRFNSNESMPLSDEQDKQVVKFMKKFKTDILTDGHRYYTRAGSGFCEVSHKKLTWYDTNPTFKNQVDIGHSFGAVILNNVKS